MEQNPWIVELTYNDNSVENLGVDTREQGRKLRKFVLGQAEQMREMTATGPIARQVTVRPNKK